MRLKNEKLKLEQDGQQRRIASEEFVQEENAQPKSRIERLRMVMAAKL